MTRGIRNNNPLNIRISKSTWKGKVLTNTDGAFEQFISMEYGYRAALVLIENYINNYGCNTIRKIISRWAPEKDGNHTEKYIQRVCGATGIGGNEVLSNADPRLKNIVAAMAEVECGKGIKDYMDSLDKAYMNFIPQSVYVSTRKKKY